MAVTLTILTLAAQETKISYNAPSHSFKTTGAGAWFAIGSDSYGLLVDYASSEFYGSASWSREGGFHDINAGPCYNIGISWETYPSNIINNPKKHLLCIPVYPLVGVMKDSTEGANLKINYGAAIGVVYKERLHLGLFAHITRTSVGLSANVGF